MPSESIYSGYMYPHVFVLYRIYYWSLIEGPGMKFLPIIILTRSVQNFCRLVELAPKLAEKKYDP